ncbi:MAG TPA: mycofactocin precursor MftA [Acidimicrobiales bacterium]|jgi:mycofactocin precursor|nr:mycofactocin precursor MftA [Acidimicrobiales bacterium]
MTALLRGNNVSPDTTTADQVTTDDTDEAVEEVLVEEISIDGMCGVY